MSSFKLKQDHWEHLIYFMENHRDFACDRFSGTNGRETHKKLWAELVHSLNNSLGYGTRSIEKWQKCWADYKSDLKKKAALINKSGGKTGGGPVFQDTLTKFELRVLNIMGQTSFEGCRTKELGFENDFQCASISFSQNINMDTDIPEDLVTVETQPNSGSTKKKEYGVNHNVSNTCDDHDYLVKTNETVTKKKKTKSLEEIHTETLVVLKSIENTIHVGLKNINDTLNQNFTLLSDILSPKP